MIKKKFALFLIAAAASAQQLTVSGPAQVFPGQTITLNVTLTGTTGQVMGFQDTVATVPALPLTVATPTALTSKSTVCGPTEVCIGVGILPQPTIDSSGNVTFATGTTMNITPIPDGTIVQTIAFTVPASTAVGTTVQTTLSGTLGVTLNGTGFGATAVAVTLAGSTVSIPVVSALSVAEQAFGTWAKAPTAANFLAAVQAMAMASAAGQ